MARHLISVALLAAAVGFSSLAIPGSGENAPPSNEPGPSGQFYQITEASRVQLFGGSDHAVALLAAALDLYEEAGMEFLDLRVYIHDSLEDCDGHQGLFGRSGDMRRIDLCNVDGPVIRHELAHVWEYHNASEADRRRYMALIEAETWNDLDSPAPARAQERAAWLIAWGVEERPLQQHLAGYHAADLEKFEILTGRASPRIRHWKTKWAGELVVVPPVVDPNRIRSRS